MMRQEVVRQEVVCQKVVRRVLIVGWLSWLCALGAPGQAQMYAGVLGSDTNWQEENISWRDLRLPGEVFGRRSAGFDKANDEARLVLGYRVGRHLAIEGGYQDLGQINRTQRLQQDGTLFGEALFHSTDVTGSSLAVLGIWPFKIKSVEVEIFAKAGAVGWEADSFVSLRRLAPTAGGLEVDTLDTVEITDRASESGVSAVYGLGVMVQLWRGLFGRVEVERIDSVGGGGTDSSRTVPADFDLEGPLTFGLEVDVPSLSGGLIYRF